MMLNENIKAIRKSKGLSQEELAIKLNVVRQTISKWETGDSLRLILSILVDTFISKISLTMQPGPKIDSISGA